MNILVSKDWHLNGRYVAECTRFGDLLYNFAAVFDQEVLIVSHPVVQNNANIDIRGYSPQSVLAATCRYNRYFAIQNRRIIWLFALVKRILNSFNHLVSLL